MVVSDGLDSAVDADYDSLFAELSRLCRALGAGGSAEDIAQDVLLEGRTRLYQLATRTACGRGFGPWPFVGSDVCAPRPGVRPTTSRRSSRSIRILAWMRLAAIAHLPERERMAVVLVYGLGYHQEEAADMLGITRGGIASSLWQARRKLARELAPYRREVEP